MSDYLPIEIQENIFKRLPVRSLIQLRSVSKDWKSFIDSSAFVNSYSRQQTQTQMQHMFLMYDDHYEQRFISIVDDDTFPVNRTPINPLPYFLPEDPPYSFNVVGSSHGVLCFYATADVEDGGRAVIWNPSIRRSFEVAVAGVPSRDVYRNVLGFGICPSTNDLKIVKITYVFRELENVTVIPSQVEVFSLTTRAWRSLHNNLPRKSLQFQDPSNITYSLDIQGVIYWLATDMIDGCCKTIISFDTTNEEFGQVNLANELARSGQYLYISKRRDSLVVLEYVVQYMEHGVLFNIWKMEDEGELGGLPKSFSKLFAFNVNTEDGLSILGFRQIGDPVIDFSDDELDQLFVYNSRTEQIINLGLNGDGFTFSMHPYKETLFLHGQPNLVPDT